MAVNTVITILRTCPQTPLLFSFSIIVELIIKNVIHPSNIRHEWRSVKKFVCFFVKKKKLFE